VTVRLAVVGDALLDRDVEGVVTRQAPDAPVPVVDQTRAIARPGGAGLAALLAARDGHAVTLVCGLARDAAGAELRGSLEGAGVALADLGLGRRTARCCASTAATAAPSATATRAPSRRRCGRPTRSSSPTTAAASRRTRRCERRWRARALRASRWCGILIRAAPSPCPAPRS
jgi:sugar/nucleoside kinase (ribokinase family)